MKWIRCQAGIAVMGMLLSAAAVRVPAGGCVPWTNRDIVHWTRSGLAPGVLRARLRLARCVAFDLSPAALLKLQKQGVAPSVLIAMVQAQQKQEEAKERLAKKNRREAGRTEAPRPRRRAPPVAPEAETAARMERQARRGLVTVEEWNQQGELLATSHGFWVSAEGLMVVSGSLPAGVTSARVTAAEGDVFDQVSVVDDDPRRGFSVLRVKGVGLPGLEWPEAGSLRPGSRVYLMDAVAGGAERLEATARPAVEASLVPGAGDGYHLVPVAVAGAGARNALVIAGRPVMNGDGQVAGMVSPYRLGDEVLILPAAEMQGLVRDRLGQRLQSADLQPRLKKPPLETAVGMLLRARSVYVWDRSRLGLDERAADEIRRRGSWQVEGDPGLADLWIVINRTGRSWTRMESLEVYDRRTRELLWSGEDHVAPFRRSAVRRLVDGLLKAVEDDGAEKRGDGGVGPGAARN